MKRIHHVLCLLIFIYFLRMKISLLEICLSFRLKHCLTNEFSQTNFLSLNQNEYCLFEIIKKRRISFLAMGKSSKRFSMRAKKNILIGFNYFLNVFFSRYILANWINAFRLKYNREARSTLASSNLFWMLFENSPPRYFSGFSYFQ